jgi:hypothetical protein
MTAGEQFNNGIAVSMTIVADLKICAENVLADRRGVHSTPLPSTCDNAAKDGPAILVICANNSRSQSYQWTEKLLLCGVLNVLCTADIRFLRWRRFSA